MKKSKLYGLIGSTLSSTILLLALWFVVLSAPSSTEKNEGFLVSLGDSDDGGGSGYAPMRQSSNNVSTEAPTRSVKTRVSSSPAKQTMFTQTDNSISLDQQKEKERVSKIQNEITAQKNEADKRKADQNRKEQAAISKANAVNGLFGNNSSRGGGRGSGNGSGNGIGSGNGSGSGKGSGNGSGNGIQGNPAGRGSSGVGSTFRLGNRNYLGNPAKPRYPKDVEGKITVNIRVNENGSVTGTSIGSPTTISDSEMRRDAMSAANRTRFTPGKNVEAGSITYNYKLE